MAAELVNLACILKQRCKGSLPGQHAHAPMMPEGRSLRIPLPAHFAHSAVLFLLYCRQQKVCFPLIERSDSGPHAGQIALPGGQNEPGELLWETALREAVEEINAPYHEIQYIGKLTELFIPVSGFLVHPFIGYTSSALSLKPLTAEVQRIIELDLFDFLHNHQKEIAFFNTAAGKVKKAPCFIYQDLKIWGATAMILNEFIELLNSIQKVIPNE